MVTILVQFDDLESLYGQKLPRDHEELNELLYSVKCELSGLSRTSPIQDNTELQLENKDTNRPDTWSPEGIARALRGLQGLELGLRKYSALRAEVEIRVDKELESIRPFICCVVAKHPKLNDAIIRGLIHLQEKLDQSYGRNRRRSSIGFYDFDLIKPPLRYGVANPDEIKFVPLQWDKTLTLREILEQHPKGIEYGHIIKEFPKMPILLDSEGKVLSFPPIINSNDLGRVTEGTKNILVEITGTSEETVSNALTILSTSLADRDAEIHSSIVHYPYGKKRTVATPNLDLRSVELQMQQVKTWTGLDLKPDEIVNLLRRARYDAAKSDSAGLLNVRVPCYRLDIMHPVDIMEDISIAYGLNNMKPKWPSDLTIGGLSRMEEFSDTVRELMVGLGFQEVLGFMMTSPDKLYGRMNRELGRPVGIANPKVATMTCLRSWLLPTLMEFVSNNTHVEYPQKLFEVGDYVDWDSALPTRTRDVRELACVSTHSKANFTEMKSNLEPLMTNLGFAFNINPIEHPSFLQGRVGSIHIGDEEVGIIGEVSPQVIENWNVQNPVAAMELELDKLLKLQS
ncbi:MAG TPA: phenylalanine--tRNA ligase subunit beta [Candidatus Acidoferrales bacterium]|nr:phenylalanine--tRNA ligase subunit beta [Candidatus Acidoferrales bacterium]